MIDAIAAAASRLICGLAVEWHCETFARRPRIYFANHSSHLDFVAIWSVLPGAQRRLARPVAGRDYWDRGAIRRLVASRLFHAILIDRNPTGVFTPGARAARSSACAARTSIQHIASEMGCRCSLIIFPEGTRTTTGEIGRFKSGLYHLARLRPDVELIPVYLENLNRILPKGECLPVPMLGRVVFGAPLAAAADEDKETFLARARDAILQLRMEP